MPTTQPAPVPDTEDLPVIQNRPTVTDPNPECHRPLYLRRVPENVWILVHDNAIRSRMRLQDYIVAILEGCEPLPH